MIQDQVEFITVKIFTVYFPKKQTSHHPRTANTMVTSASNLGLNKVTSGPS